MALLQETSDLGKRDGRAAPQPFLSVCLRTSLGFSWGNAMVNYLTLM